MGRYTIHTMDIMSWAKVKVPINVCLQRGCTVIGVLSQTYLGIKCVHLQDTVSYERVSGAVGCVEVRQVARENRYDRQRSIRVTSTYRVTPHK